MQFSSAQSMAAQARDVAARDLAPPTSGHGHAVRFYEDEELLSAAVADFLAAGLTVGQPLVVIATAPRRDALTRRLAAEGFDVDGARSGGRLTMLDAREALAAFMVDAVPDPARFRAVVGPVLERAAGRSADAVLRVYGEMVDVLWKDGNTDGALRLEELWNELAGTHSFSLLCAYAMGNFYRAADAERLREVCRHHTHVIPAEPYSQGDDAARLREIALLQQRARALEAELEHRKELEHRLRETLAARRRAEEALRRSEDELQDFLENATQGIHWVGPDGMILWANKAELELLGYAREEYVGRHVADFHADRHVIEDMLARLARGETLTGYEARLRCKDGSVRDVVVNSNVLWRDGRFVHTRCFTHDITELKRAAAEREQLLERERQARAEAEAANRAKSEFLAVMSHELRTPLNAIGGHAQLIEMGVHGPVTDAQRDALRRIERSQRHLLALINDVLNLTRIEAGRVEYALEPVPLGPLLAEVVSTLEPLLSAKGLACEVSADSDETAVVTADREKAHQIVLNLLTNAIKYTTAGGRITVEAAPCPDRPAMACVRVRDTGVGIPAEQLERVFEPFVQLGRPASGRPDGIGLGLAISRDLARGMGGDLTAESTPGMGSTFTLVLPRA